MADERLFTQEEVDALIGERLSRQKEKLTNEYNDRYSDYEEVKSAFETSKTEHASQIEQLTNSLNEAKEKLTGTDQTISELNSKIATYETDSVKTRVAMELGIPYKMASRINGATEEEIREDALEMAKMFTKSQPMATPGDNESDGVLAAFKKLNPNIKI